MKKITLFLTLLLLPLGLFATDCIPDCECETDWTLEVRGAYYYLPSRSLRQIAASQWLDYQVETAKRVHDFVEVWGGVSWASKHGHKHRYEEDHHFRDRTRIFILPVSLGLKLIYPILPRTDIYIGGGICYSFLRIKNFCNEHDSHHKFSHSLFKKNVYKNDCGAVVKAGFQFAMSDSTFLDFFADYYIQRFHLSHKDDHHHGHYLDCSGFKCGIGLGVYF